MFKYLKCVETKKGAFILYLEGEKCIYRVYAKFCPNVEIGQMVRFVPQMEMDKLNFGYIEKLVS